jgi:nucleotide-binding universal stress UspA family protein
MTYTNLMVHLTLGRSNADLLKFTAELADRFNAGIVGIAVCQPPPMMYGDGYVAGELLEKDRDDIVKAFKTAEVEFREALQSRVPQLEWRSAQMYAYLVDYLANEARCADLIVTRAASGDFGDISRSVNTGDLIMKAGRPVLIVPTGSSALKLDCAVIGWKDTREARRAVSDAIPMLKQVARVVVVEIADKEGLDTGHKHVQDVTKWLKRHGVKSEGWAQASTGDDAAALYAVAQDSGADVTVTGAYGHSRLREWAFGGVTKELLKCQERCSLLSH